MDFEGAQLNVPSLLSNGRGSNGIRFRKKFSLVKASVVHCGVQLEDILGIFRGLEGYHYDFIRNG